MHAGAGGEAAEHAERALVLARQIQARRFEAEALVATEPSLRVHNGSGSSSRSMLDRSAAAVYKPRAQGLEPLTMD